MNDALIKEFNHRVNVIKDLYSLSDEILLNIFLAGDIFIQIKKNNPGSRLIHAYFYLLFSLIFSKWEGMNFTQQYNSLIEITQRRLTESEKSIYLWTASF